MFATCTAQRAHASRLCGPAVARLRLVPAPKQGPQERPVRLPLRSIFPGEGEEVDLPNAIGVSGTEAQQEHVVRFGARRCACRADPESPLSWQHMLEPVHLVEQ